MASATPLLQQPKNGNVPQVCYGASIVGGDRFVELSPALTKVAGVFLPPPVKVAEALVALKEANPDAFQRPHDAEHSFFIRQLDNNLVATTFMRVLREHHGTAASSRRSWFSHVRTAYYTLRNRSSLILSIEVVEQMAAQLRVSKDLMEFIVQHSGAQFHKHAFTSEPDEGIQLASLVADKILKVLFMLLVVSGGPHNGLCHQPSQEMLGKVQLFSKTSDGDYTGGDFDMKDAVLPFHPEWFGDTVPLFQERPYHTWKTRWLQDRNFTGVASNIDHAQLCEDKLAVANTLITAVCGELKRLDQEAVMLQNKLVGLGTTFFTTLGTYLIQHFHRQTTAA